MKKDGSKKVQVHMPYPYLLENYEKALKENINPEIYIDGEFLEGAAPEDLKEIREGFGGRGLTITLHGPYIDLNPGSADEDKRLATEKRYEETFRVVSFLKPKNVVLHAGYSERKYKGDFELWLAQSLKTWPRFVRLAEELNTVIAVENIFEKSPDTLKMLVERVGSPNFGVCIDAGHLNVFSVRGMGEWFKDLGPFIAEVHIHDNTGKGDDHLPAGEGSIDFPLFFSLLKTYSRDPVYTIEPHGEVMIKRAIKAIRKFI